mgnify:CR=1 FL=1
MKGPMRRRIDSPFIAVLLALLLVGVASTIPTRTARAGGVPLPGEPNPDTPPQPDEGDPDVPTGSGRSQPQGGTRPTPVARPQWGGPGAVMPSPNGPSAGYVLMMRTALSVWFRLHLPF